MVHKASIRMAALCLITCQPAWASAQTPATHKSSSVASVTNEKELISKRPKSAAAEAQHTSALDIIKSLADEASTYKDQSLRVRVQARAADALWESDSVLAHNLFLRAWQAADKIDRASQRDAEEARKSFLTSRKGLAFIPAAMNLRSEVLYLVVRRDQRLGEDLLTEIGKSKESEVSAESSSTSDSEPDPFDPTQPDLATARRLELAIELVRGDKVEQAKTFASAGLERVTSQGIVFLSTLRQRDAAAADELYSNLLVKTANDSSSDATTISLLSSYVFTPNLLITATRQGRVFNDLSDVIPASALPEGLRPGFFRVAADVLLRRVPPTEEDRTSAGRAGAYFTIARLLPLFEEHAPDQLPALNARLAFLSPDVPPEYKNNDNGMLKAGIGGNNLGEDTLSDILYKLSGTVGLDERDTLYVKAIRVAAANGDGRIREFANRIDNTDLKKWARQFSDFVAVRKALDEKDVEGGLKIISVGGLSPIQRVWAYSQAAALLRQSDAPRAMQLLTEALSVARNIDHGDIDRVHALSCVASHFFNLDRQRAWEIATDVLKAADAVPQFAADEGKLTAQLQARGVVAVVNLNVPTFTLTNFFELLAKDNPIRAAEMARGLKGEAPRATAHLAVARTLLRRG